MCLDFASICTVYTFWVIILNINKPIYNNFDSVLTFSETTPQYRGTVHYLHKITVQ